ncbi:MAG: hypothetical protein AAF204_04740 [Pseudomonadota bacterium]
MKTVFEIIGFTIFVAIVSIPSISLYFGIHDIPLTLEAMSQPFAAMMFVLPIVAILAFVIVKMKVPKMEGKHYISLAALPLAQFLGVVVLMMSNPEAYAKPELAAALQELQDKKDGIVRDKEVSTD